MDYSNRPARKQKAAGVGPQRHSRDEGSYNIWYGSKGKREDRDAKRAETRCNPKLDCGYTRAGKGEAICVFFAQGRCSNGSDCDYQHKLPDEECEKRLGPAVDVFGRERFGSERQDMGGIGSFSRENRTLYIGRIPAMRPDMEKAVRQQFGEFGLLESVKVLADKNCAFAKYRLRSAAEFAKEAMASQSLFPGDQPMNLRWATEDPNPGVQKKEKVNMVDKARQALEAQGVCLKQAEFDFPAHYALPDSSSGYPNTDHQYSSGSGGVASAYPNTDHQYASAAPLPPPPGRPPAAGERWVQYLAPQGYPYFFNPSTNETRWQPPAGAVITLGAPAFQADHVFETDASAYEEAAETSGTNPKDSNSEDSKSAPGDALAGLADYGDDSDDS